MTELAQIAPAFIEMAHRIVWCSAATVDKRGRPRSRVLHPLWHWDGQRLSGVIATSPTPTKRAHWAFDDATRERVWDAFKNAPAPVGYDPAIVPPWKGGPTSAAFAVLQLEPWRLRVMPGTMMLGGGGALLHWRE